MIYDVGKLAGRTIFVDANAILYHLQGLCPTSKAVFRMGEGGGLKLITTTRVLDEAIHKTVLIRARDRFGYTTKTIQKLRRNRARLKELAQDANALFDFCRAVRMDIQGISVRDLEKVPKMMSRYGVLGNDALILVVMTRQNLKYLLSADTDFDDVGWISRIPAGFNGKE